MTNKDAAKVEWETPEEELLRLVQDWADRRRSELSCYTLHDIECGINISIKASLDSVSKKKAWDSLIAMGRAHA